LVWFGCEAFHALYGEGVEFQAAMADDWKSRATSALELGMASDLAQAYFNDPVDPEALGIPEYYEVIKTPMDLGTCKAKLMRGDYVKAQELLRDVQLVWSNCRYVRTRQSEAE